MGHTEDPGHPLIANLGKASFHVKRQRCNSDGTGGLGRGCFADVGEEGVYVRFGGIECGHPADHRPLLVPDVEGPPLLQGGDVARHKQLMLFCLEHVYARMTPSAICLLMDYCDHKLVDAWDCNPGVKLACDEFFKEKSESISVLYGGEYCHGYFRKKTM